MTGQRLRRVLGKEGRSERSKAMEFNYGLIFSYGIQMTVTFLVGLGLYTLKVSVSRVQITDWYRAQLHRIVISLVVFWLISTALVIVPNFAQILGSFGFNADASAAGIALVVVGFLIGGQTTPEDEVEENL